MNVKNIALSATFIALLGGGWYVYQSGLLTGALAPVSSNTGGSLPIVVRPDAPSATDTLQRILSTHVVRISVQNPSEPIYGEPNGVPHGFNWDFAHLLFAQPKFAATGPIKIDTHHEVDAYVDVPRQLLASTGGQPSVDVAMDGLTFPDNTPAGVVYTNPYLDDFGYALIVGADSPIRSATDAAGKTIGVLQGDPDVKAFVQRAFPGSRIVEVNDADPHFVDKSVDGHVVDAFVYDYPFAVDSIKGTDLHFAVTKLEGSSISYKIGVRASDADLLMTLNSAIARVKASPEYLVLMRRYFISHQALTTAATAGERTYRVRPGDRLASIAARQLGAASRYREIQTRNNLPNPNLILVGQALVIPQR
ncbi:transporter substrate-binding and LysM peptidoglycan-binding domain-containing protein [Burkholderia pyrrocinia]|uniref:transporter substrate-binding and LysM peptidoglycan-binding domain-containing protein n=1 Tax=Burkholderia pyrrocinia TaxID=60550 RepID=UPI001BD0372F|nr:transporter substrate-binding domain-containing protein [Burkholderia pyrrocinia]QVN18950.1 transporter substrate-binding domain-containing protein [Burkholderia pyrrocinia]